MTSNNPNSGKIITKVIVPIVVALVGGGFWQFWQFLLSKDSDSKDCQINASPLIVERVTIQANQSTKVSIRADNPDGKSILYNWQAVNGQMNPSTRSNTPTATYTAPSKDVDDTISVDITLPGCKSVRRSHSISVIVSSSSTPSKKPSASTTKETTKNKNSVINNSEQSIPQANSVLSASFKVEHDFEKSNVIYPVFSSVCRDPWVTKAVSQVTGRPPKGQDDRGECNIRLYGNGYWSSYEDLVKKVKDAKASYEPGVCRDSWVTKAVTQASGRDPKGYGEVGECDMYLYGNGFWSDYRDLMSKVATTLHK
ncbi:MAG: hypothetical protein KME49_07775 [Brasilonema octagenarum HA4186-MV1]|jgi:hypothetical protein|nr:hypothetical protein [Brasilonema octagenarum HA4186-MV1]